MPQFGQAIPAREQAILVDGTDDDDVVREMASLRRGASPSSRSTRYVDCVVAAAVDNLGRASPSSRTSMWYVRTRARNAASSRLNSRAAHPPARRFIADRAGYSITMSMMCFSDCDVIGRSQARSGRGRRTGGAGSRRFLGDRALSSAGWIRSLCRWRWRDRPSITLHMFHLFAHRVYANRRSGACPRRRWCRTPRGPGISAITRRFRQIPTSTLRRLCARAAHGNPVVSHTVSGGPGGRLWPARDRMAHDWIAVRGARVHNLRNVDVDLPRDRLVVITGPLRVRQVVAGVRHHLRRGPAPLRRVALGLRPAVPRADGEAGRRPDRGPLAGDLHRAEDHRLQPALDRRHGHRDLRLPPPALRQHRRRRTARTATARSRRSRSSASWTW